MATTITAGNATNGAAISSDNTGILELKSGTGSGTTALTLNASQNATLAGTLTVGSTLQVAGVTTNMYPIVSGTAVTASGTSVDFTSIPSWVRRITVMFQGLSTNGTSTVQIQIGSGSFTTSGYLGAVAFTGGGSTGVNLTSGFGVANGVVASSIVHGVATLVNITGNSWAYGINGGFSSTAAGINGGGSITLSGTLDRLRLYIDGTQQFDAGTINIMWE